MTVLDFGWLVLVVFWGLKGSWGKLFLLGLILDLVTSRTLGVHSGLGLVVGWLVFISKRFLPVKTPRQIKLRFSDED